MSDISRQADDRRRDRQSQADLFLTVVAAIVGALNLAFVVIDPYDYHGYGHSSIAWMVFGLGALVWQLVKRECSWSRVALILAGAAVGFWLNAAMLVGMVNSV